MLQIGGTTMELDNQRLKISAVVRENKEKAELAESLALGIKTQIFGDSDMRKGDVESPEYSVQENLELTHNTLDRILSILTEIAEKL